MEQFLLKLLSYVQPSVVLVFLFSGICNMLLGRWHYMAMNFTFSFANWLVFYGAKFFTR